MSDLDLEIVDLLRERADIYRQEAVVTADIRAIKLERSLACGQPWYNRLTSQTAERLKSNRDAMAAMSTRKKEIKARLTQLRPQFTFEHAFYAAAKEILPPEDFQRIQAAAQMK